MQWINNQERYGALSIAMHWLMVLLFAAVYVCADLRGIFPRGSGLREGMKVWHNMLGLLIFALVWLRLAFFLVGTRPADDTAVPRWQKRMAALAHGLLYALMVLLPLTGWLALSAGGATGYALIGLHAAAALFHHYVIRDNTLRRMLP